MKVRVEVEQMSDMPEPIQKDDDQLHRFMQTLNISKFMHIVLTAIMNPPDDLKELKQQDTCSLLNIFVSNSKPQDGQVSPSKFPGSADQEHPSGLMSSEWRNIQDIFTNVALSIRPHYFEPGDSATKIFDHIIHESVETKTLDKFAESLKNCIKVEVTDLSHQHLMCDFIDEVVKLLHSIMSGDHNNDPLNKYAEINDTSNLSELQSWLETNSQTHDIMPAEFKDKSERLFQARMQELIEKIFNMCKQLDPPSAGQDLDAFSYLAQKHNESKRKKFSSLVLNYDKNNSLEPNRLKYFWEIVTRFQLGKVFYDYMCESFSCHDDVHKRVQIIWALSCLDTINCHPLEARSVMPNASRDGSVVQNFGYCMSTSQPYLNWVLHNTMARACGDVIVDAFHFTVDLGCNFRIYDFLEQWKIYNTAYSSLTVMEYEMIMHPFECFLYRMLYGYDFKEGELYAELLKKAGSLEALSGQAEIYLQHFKTFAGEMIKRRPNPNGASLDSFYGLVLQIGFNGQLFDAPSHSKENRNEIWLTFSASGRDPGGILLLMFLRRVATDLSKVFTDTVVNHIKLPNDFSHYKALIHHHLSISTTNAEQCKQFLPQLERDVHFDFLSTELVTWIRTLSNWYGVPPNINFGVPDEMKPEEHCVQEFTRYLLFDVLVKRRFSAERSELMPYLFTHWKAKLLELLPTLEPKDTLSMLPQDLKQRVFDYLDQLVVNANPTLIQEWNVGKYGITEQFNDFMKPEIKALKNKIARAAIDTTTLQKLIENENKNENENKDILSRLQMACQNHDQYVLEMQQLPKTPSELSLEKYVGFYNSFFKNRDVGQCAEPLLAKVLGHDRFYSVFLSRKVNDKKIMVESKTFQLGNRFAQDVIPPCERKCQCHVLGHLYVGDVLTHLSADRLDAMRQTHGCGAVPCQLMPVQALQQVLFHNPPQARDNVMPAQPDHTTSTPDSSYDDATTVEQSNTS